MFNGDRLPTVEAARVRLRWLVDSDVDDLYTIFASQDVTRYWSWRAYTERAQAEALLADIHQLFAEGSLYQWGVALRETDQVVGTCTLWQIDQEHGRAEIGFALAREHWGHGLMGEAAQALLTQCFQSWGLRRIEADVDPRNEGSLRLLTRFGFQREGVMRQRYLVDGELQDSVWLGLLAHEFQRPFS